MNSIRNQTEQPYNGMAFRCRGAIALRAAVFIGLALVLRTISAQDGINLVENNPAGGSSTGSNGDDFDSLLQMAEQDISQLTQVKVAQKVRSLDTEVTTVSRTASTVGKSPAAIFVITNDMIRRSGAMSIPEVLRMAPGVNVARIDSNHWAISIRGFNNQYANKLLVQVDGRSVYTPLFSGVIWAAQDVLLEDVDRIEVIRGPGGAMWGANAVNGVINIITKNAAATQGAFAQAGGGNYERGFVNGRYGGQIGNDIDYRIYGKWFERGTGVPQSGTEFDDWRSARSGFRLDWDPGRYGTDRFTLQGDNYETPVGLREQLPSFTPPFSTTVDSDTFYRGSNVLGRWTHAIDDERDWQLQAYYDYTQIDAESQSFVERRNTIDLDFQYRMPLGERQKIVWGAGYRLTADHEITTPFPLSFIPPRQDVQMFSYFLQDEIALVPDRWSATLGCKFLNNTYTNFEYQPTARLLYTPDERHSMWGAVSRAVRIPSRVEETILVTLPPPIPAPVFPQFRGNNGLVSEDLLAWEWGYRAQPVDDFSWDLALFFNQYENLIVANPGLPQLAPFGLVIPLTAVNAARAQSYGFELASNVEMTDSWKLRLAYSFLRLQFLGIANDAEGLSPVNQVYLQSSHNLGPGVELDLIGRYTDTLVTGSVPAYFVGDARLAWHYRPGVELFVVGRGLFDNGHLEFNSSDSGVSTGVRSEIYAGVSIRR